MSTFSRFFVYVEITCQNLKLGINLLLIGSYWFKKFIRSFWKWSIVIARFVRIKHFWSQFRGIRAIQMSPMIDFPRRSPLETPQNGRQIGNVCIITTSFGITLSHSWVIDFTGMHIQLNIIVSGQVTWSAWSSIKKFLLRRNLSPK